MKQPVHIETQRLVLRPHCREDFEALCALWADPEVVRHIGGRPNTRQESWMRLLRYAGFWQILGYGFWAIWEKSSGRFIGDIGFHDVCREIEPSIFGMPEAGWVLSPWAHGQGYASEALAAALAWLDGQTPHAASVCLIAPGNVASIRLAERHGYGDAKTVRFMEQDTLVMRREKGLARGQSARG